MSNLKIKNKKSGAESTVTQEGWRKMIETGLSKKYNILEETNDDAPKEKVQVPEELKARTAMTNATAPKKSAKSRNQ